MKNSRNAKIKRNEIQEVFTIICVKICAKKAEKGEIYYSDVVDIVEEGERKILKLLKIIK